MHNYNFDQIIDRKGSGDIKHDALKPRWGRDDLLPLWVADMDFATPPFIVDALRKRLEHPIFGYTTTPNERYFAPREGSWIKVSGTKNYAHTQNWTISTLYFHTPTSVTIKSNDGKGHISEHKFTGSTAVQKLEVKDSLNSIGFAFKGVGSGTFLYGLTLDGDKGVTLDNFSMRGSPGLTLAKIPTHRLQDFS